jgi:hypothetical protein
VPLGLFSLGRVLRLHKFMKGRWMITGSCGQAQCIYSLSGENLRRDARLAPVGGAAWSYRGALHSGRPVSATAPGIAHGTAVRASCIYVPPADVQIAWPDEQAATQSRMAIATGTGLILHIRGLSCRPFGCDIRNSKICSYQNRALLVGARPSPQCAEVMRGPGVSEGDCSSQGHYPPRRERVEPG